MPETIEAEVVEIDGSPPPPPRQPQPGPRRGDQAWRSMGGKILKLDRRWWPLWVLLGIVVIALLLTVGVIVGVLLFVARIIGGFLRLVTGGGSTRSGSSLSRRL